MAAWQRLAACLASLLCYNNSVRINWDKNKSARNARKHGVTFAEAATAFDDPDGCYLRNETPSYEDRLILIGYSCTPRLLYVVHAEVGRDSIRIVSARRASRAQKRIYEGLD
jgi:hypothetical protein